jgi:hypothetical protein
MITRRSTSKAQATIPKAGDEAMLTRSNVGVEADDPFATFAEWNSTANSESYGKSPASVTSPGQTASKSL